MISVGAAPYAGLKVLDFSHVIAGPLCTRLLADLGADVVKIEPRTGDLMRALPIPVAETVTSAFVQYGCGKRSIGLDLKHEAGREVALRLAAWADIAVENFSPDALNRLGLGFDVLSSVNPRLILCSISTFGATGPYAHHGGFGALAEAHSGLMSLTGVDDGPPTHFGTPLADMNSGVHALAAIGAALHQRARTGHGTHIDLASLDALITMIDQAVTLEEFSQGRQHFGRYANRHPTTVPSGVLRAGDGHYAVYAAVGDRQFATFCEAIGHPALPADDRFAETRQRVANRTQLYELIEAWASDIPTADEAVERLTRVGLTAGRVRSIPEMMDDDHVRAREVLQAVDIPGAGVRRVQVAPYRFNGEPARVSGPPPQLGADTISVLAELGLDQAEIDQLADLDVIHFPPTDTPGGSS